MTTGVGTFENRQVSAALTGAPSFPILSATGAFANRDVSAALAGALITVGDSVFVVSEHSSSLSATQIVGLPGESSGQLVFQPQLGTVLGGESSGLVVFA